MCERKPDVSRRLSASVHDGGGSIPYVVAGGAAGVKSRLRVRPPYLAAGEQRGHAPAVDEQRGFYLQQGTRGTAHNTVRRVKAVREILASNVGNNMPTPHLYFVVRGEFGGPQNDRTPDLNNRRSQRRNK